MHGQTFTPLKVIIRRNTKQTLRGKTCFFLVGNLPILYRPCDIIGYSVIWYGMAATSLPADSLLSVELRA